MLPEEEGQLAGLNKHGEGLRRGETYHARAGECVPTETDTIAILNIAPLLLERLVVGHIGSGRGRDLLLRYGPRASTPWGFRRAQIGR